MAATRAVTKASQPGRVPTETPRPLQRNGFAEWARGIRAHNLRSLARGSADGRRDPRNPLFRNGFRLGRTVVGTGGNWRVSDAIGGAIGGNETADAVPWEVKSSRTDITVLPTTMRIPSSAGSSAPPGPPTDGTPDPPADQDRRARSPIYGASGPLRIAAAPARPPRRRRVHGVCAGRASSSPRG